MHHVSVKLVSAAGAELHEGASAAEWEVCRAEWTETAQSKLAAKSWLGRQAWDLGRSGVSEIDPPEHFVGSRVLRNAAN